MRLPDQPEFHAEVQVLDDGPDALDPVAMLQRLDDNLELLQELAAMFLEDYPPLVAEIRAAIRDNDADQLRRSAHKLRGMIGNFGKPSAFEIAGQLEAMSKDGDLTAARVTLQRLDLALQPVERVFGRLIA